MKTIFIFNLSSLRILCKSMINRNVISYERSKIKTILKIPKILDVDDFNAKQLCH